MDGTRTLQSGGLWSADERIKIRAISECVTIWSIDECIRCFRFGNGNLRGEKYPPRNTLPMLITLFRTSLQVFAGQVPFPHCRTSAVVVKKLIDGERPQRPPKGKKLGLSDKLWEIIRSSLALEAEERPPVRTFVEYLEKATPDMAVLNKLMQFDANSEDDIRELRSVFECGDNTLFGMRVDEALVAIEVFDRVGSLVRHLALTPQL